MNERNRVLDDDVALSALLDGALTAEESEKLRRRMVEEPALALRFDELGGVDKAVRGTFEGIANEPLPHRVTRLLDPPARFRAAPRPVRRSRLSTFAPAALALAAGFLLALIVIPRSGPAGPLGLVAEGGFIAEGAALHDVLQTSASDETRSIGTGWSATPRLTFRSVGGDPCRRIDLSSGDRGIETLACRRQGAWRLELIGFDAPDVPGTNGVYRPATGSASRIDAAIDTLIDGPPLGRNAEAELIARGWD